MTNYNGIKVVIRIDCGPNLNFNEKGKKNNIYIYMVMLLAVYPTYDCGGEQRFSLVYVM